MVLAVLVHQVIVKMENKEWSKKDRNLFGVADVTAQVHMFTNESMETDYESEKELVSWLRWRVSDGWDCDYKIDRDFPDALRSLAKLSLSEYDSKNTNV